MRIGIVGARVHGRPDLVRSFVRSLPAGTVVVSGGAPDVDTWAEEEARAAGLEVVVHAPAARTREAYLARDRLIAGDVEELHAWPWLGARGTHYTARIARERGVPVVEHPPEPRCEVFTARWGLRGEPAIFNIMRGWAMKYPARGTWAQTPPAYRERQGIDWVRAQLAPGTDGRDGLSLLEVQKLAAKDGVPSLGEPWAPSAELLWPALEERQHDLAKRRAHEVSAAHLDREPTLEEDQRRLAAEAEIEGIELDHWARYTVGYRAEMVQSYRARALSWGWLLTLPRVVLACPCPVPERCHRSLAAAMLGKCGATLGGEIAG